MQYIGRFAPSPTGLLHLGSLYTALASFLHARANQGLWRLRIDDLDHCRNINTAHEAIIETLQGYQLHWDGEVYYQSQHLEAYQTAITQLKQQQAIYPCTCSRKSLSHYNTTIYPRICRQHPTSKTPFALRLKTNNRTIHFNDELQGLQACQLAQHVGDFIVQRKDHVIAYQLAVTVDDYQQNISHIIRGCDLLDSTPKQLFIQHGLGYTAPSYCHLPILTNQQGEKLSKQTCAEAVSINQPEKTLLLLLKLLHQNPPKSLKNASVNTLINWGVEHWQPHFLKNISAIKT